MRIRRVLAGAACAALLGGCAVIHVADSNFAAPVPSVSVTATEEDGLIDRFTGPLVVSSAILRRGTQVQSASATSTPSANQASTTANVALGGGFQPGDSLELHWSGPVLYALTNAVGTVGKTSTHKFELPRLQLAAVTVNRFLPGTTAEVCVGLDRPLPVDLTVTLHSFNGPGAPNPGTVVIPAGRTIGPTSQVAALRSCPTDDTHVSTPAPVPCGLSGGVSGRATFGGQNLFACIDLSPSCACTAEHPCGTAFPVPPTAPPRPAICP